MGNSCRGSWNLAIGGGGGENQCINMRRIDVRHLKCLLAALNRQACGGATHVTAMNARAFADPFVARVHGL